MANLPFPFKPRMAACAFELDPSSPKRVQIFPAGTFDAPLGAMQGAGPWRLDAAAAARLIRRVASRKTPVHFDYHHASLTAAQNGHKAPAAGWLETANLVWEEGLGLFGVDVQWTEQAAAEIASREFRFLSPVFSYDKHGVPLDLFSIALTNTPAIDGMSELLAAASSTLLESPMDDLLERLCYLLNLPLTTTPEEMSGQLDKLKGLLAQTPSTAATGLVQAWEAREAELAALQAARPDPAQYAPVAALSAMQQELAELKAKSLARDIEDMTGPALQDGRLLPAQADWARELGRSNLAALQQFLATAKPVAALAGMQTGGQAPAGAATVADDAESLAAAATAYQAQQAQLGVAVDDIAAIQHVRGARP